MKNSQQSELQDDLQLQAILAECLEKLERGASLDRETIERRHPLYAVQLRELVVNEQVYRM